MNKTYLLIRLLALFFLGLIVYSNSFSNQFLIDDHAFLANPTTNNTDHLLLQFSPYQHLGQSIDFHMGNPLTYYRPLAHIVPAVCYTLFGKHFWQYHLFNLFLFVLASFLIYLCVYRISKDDLLAFLVSVFYIIHPINGIVVNYITASVFALQVIFIAGSILCVWESIHHQDDRSLYYSSLLLMVLALLCHETSIMTPFYVGAVLMITKCLDIKKLIRCLVPYFLILFTYLLFRTYFISLNDIVLKQMATYKMNFFEYAATLFTIIKWYIGQLFYPHGIVMVWATPVVREDLVFNDLGLLGLACLFISSVFYFRRNPVVQIGLVWFLMGFLPMAAAPFSRPFDGVDIEPHWFVFSVTGFFIVLAHSFLSVYSKIGRSKGWMVGFLLVLLGVSWINDSQRYNRLWFNQRTYAIYWSSQAPQIKSIYGYIAYAYSLEGNWEEARKNYLLSLTGTVNDGQMYLNLGLIERKMGHFKEAEAYYQTGLKILPSSFGICSNLGSLYFRSGNLDLAQEYYLRALIRNPSALPILKALISISIKRNDLRGLNAYIKLYLENEKNPHELLRLGDVMYKDHLYGLALRSYHQAAANDPDYGQTRELIAKEKYLFRILRSQSSL